MCEPVAKEELAWKHHWSLMDFVAPEGPVGVNQTTVSNNDWLESLIQGRLPGGDSTFAELLKDG